MGVGRRVRENEGGMPCSLAELSLTCWSDPERSVAGGQAVRLCMYICVFEQQRGERNEQSGDKGIKMDQTVYKKRGKEREREGEEVRNLIGHRKRA